MFFAILLVLSVVDVYGAKRGDYCNKNGVAGVCTIIKECPDALEDIKNKRKPQHCDLGEVEAIVCCTSPNINTISPPKGNCILPPSSGYGYNRQVPKCVSSCYLPLHPSVEYECLVSGVTGTRPCRDHEPHGTVVSPRCNAPYYYSPTTPTYMHCINGTWDYIAKCSLECGKVTPVGTQLISGTKTDIRGRAPWHASIYTKVNDRHVHICGGSLISTRTIISAAQCFWSYIDGKQPESHYAVAVGKLYRIWESDQAEKSQYSDVKEIHLPETYQGVEVDFQDDIAVVVVSAAFELKAHIRPVCVNFDYIPERRQLDTGNKGKIAGWGLTTKTSDTSRELKVLEVPYVSFATCSSEWPDSFREYMAGDKICAEQNVTEGLLALSKGDNGGGLAFPMIEQDSVRYYLRGVLNLALSSCGADREHCATTTYLGFTRISHHEKFIKRFWGNDL